MGNVYNRKRVEAAEKAANGLLNFVNAFGIDQQAFAKTIAKGHRTLQQSTMRLMMETIRCISENGYDDRNEATVQLAKEITKQFGDRTLPFI